MNDGADISKPQYHLPGARLRECLVELLGGDAYHRTEQPTLHEGDGRRLDERPDRHQIRVHGECPASDGLADQPRNRGIRPQCVDMTSEAWTVEHLPIRHTRHQADEQQNARHGGEDCGGSAADRDT
jgi:hypothetical protein